MAPWMHCPVEKANSRAQDLRVEMKEKWSSEIPVALRELKRENASPGLLLME